MIPVLKASLFGVGIIACAASALEPDLAKGGSNRIAELTVAPDSLVLNVSDIGSATCIPKSVNGQPLKNPCTWKSTDTNTVRVTSGSQTTTITARKIGQVTVTATAGGKSATLTVRVVGTATLAKVNLTPAAVTLDTGTTQQFAAGDVMSDGSAKAFAGTYSATGGTVTGVGLYKAGPAAGNYRVIAIESGKADTSLVTVTAPAPPQSCSPSATTICPGDSWQAKVNAAGSGTVFTVGTGVHRLQTVIPKQGQQFIAQPGAVMSGAKLLTGWTQSGATWYVGGQTQEFAHTAGECASGTACQYPEDVYRDDVLLHRELSLAAVGPGDFYFDYAADRIYVGDDPAGHKLEGAATEYAFGSSSDGSGTGVVLDGLTVEKYANAAQMGAIGRSNTAQGWVIRNCDVRFNHGVAIRTGSIQVRSSHLHHNGEAGIVGGGDAGTLIRDTEIDHNNTAGFSAPWEASGLKFAGGTIVGVKVIHNNIHDNNGIGLWADGFNDQFVWDSNTVANNAWDGIKVEISGGGKVRWNTVTGNGFTNPNAQEGDGIMVYTSGGTGLEIAFNTVSGNKNGIVLLAADRGGPVTQNVSVHDNTVTLTGNQRTGAYRYGGSTGLWTTDNNHFEGNHYTLTGALAAPFIWTNNAGLTEAQWQAAGNDETGSVAR